MSKTTKPRANKARPHRAARRRVSPPAQISVRPIAREITRLHDGSHVGWSLYVEDYERAVTAMAAVVLAHALTSDEAPAHCARAALQSIGITPRNKELSNEHHDH